MIRQRWAITVQQAPSAARQMSAVALALNTAEKIAQSSSFQAIQTSTARQAAETTDCSGVGK